MEPPVPAAPANAADFWRHAPERLLALLRFATIAVALAAALQFTDDAICGVVNLSLFLIPAALLLALSGRWVIAASAAAMLTIFLFLVGEMKLRFLGDRLAVADFVFLIEMANWRIVGQYPEMGQLLALLGGLAALLAIDARVAMRGTAALGWRGRAAALALALLLAAFAFSQRHFHEWEVFRDDSDCGPMHICGVGARLLYSTQIFDYERPVPLGSPARFLAAMPPPESAPTLPAAAAATPPDIVLWLHESTFDPRNFHLPAARLPALAMFEDTRRTRASGALRVHTFGGRTWLSEFSVLTGLVPDDFGARRNLVFNTIAPYTQSNLVRLLGDNGYRRLALLPTPRRFYGAGETYAAMGFDEVLTLRDFPEYARLSGDEWELATSPRLAEAAQALIARHRAGPRAAQPLFVYLLSVKEHAPYDRGTPVDFGLERSGLAPTLAARLTDYIGRLQTLDAAVRELERFLFAKRARPAMFAYFGDHQAYFEESPPEYRLDWRHDWPDPERITQFQLRTNYPALRPARVPVLDIAFLPSLVADVAGLRSDAHFEALSKLRGLCTGRRDDCADRELLASYKAFLFGESLGLLAPAD